MNRNEAIAGYVAATVATVLNVAFTILVAIYPPPEWHGVTEYAATFRPEAQAPILPSLALAPTLVVLMTAIFYYGPRSKELFGRLGVVFSIPYCALASVNYFVQLTMVRQSILDHDVQGLAPFVMDNPHSMALAIDILAYMFLFLASLFAAEMFRAGGLETAVRWFFRLTAIIGIVGVIGFTVKNDILRIGILASGVPFLIATALLVVLFRRSLASAR